MGAFGAGTVGIAGGVVDPGDDVESGRFDTGQLWYPILGIGWQSTLVSVPIGGMAGIEPVTAVAMADVSEFAGLRAPRIVHAAPVAGHRAPPHRGFTVNFPLPAKGSLCSLGGVPPPSTTTTIRKD